MRWLLFVSVINAVGAQSCNAPDCQSCTSNPGCVWSSSGCATTCQTTQSCVNNVAQCPVAAYAGNSVSGAIYGSAALLPPASSAPLYAGNVAVYGGPASVPYTAPAGIYAAGVYAPAVYAPAGMYAPANVYAPAGIYGSPAGIYGSPAGIYGSPAGIYGSVAASGIYSPYGSPYPYGAPYVASGFVQSVPTVSAAAFGINGPAPTVTNAEGDCAKGRFVLGDDYYDTYCNGASTAIPNANAGAQPNAGA